MKERTIYITQFDLERLEGILAGFDESDFRDRQDIEELENELAEGKVVESKDVPPNIVTMNSRVRLIDLQNNSTMEYTLVFPKEADINAGRLSVLSPIGTAILGYSEGDTIEWRVPGGIREIKIEKILYQPEAAGDYHL